MNRKAKKLIARLFCFVLPPNMAAPALAQNIKEDGIPQEVISRLDSKSAIKEAGSTRFIKLLAIILLLSLVALHLYNSLPYMPPLLRHSLVTGLETRLMMDCPVKSVSTFYRRDQCVQVQVELWYGGEEAVLDIFATAREFLLENDAAGQWEALASPYASLELNVSGPGGLLDFSHYSLTSGYYWENYNSAKSSYTYNGFSGWTGVRHANGRETPICLDGPE